MKPMLAVKFVEDKADYPYLLSPKIDGIRGVIDKRTVKSRSMKPLPNRHLQEKFGQDTLSGLDGEFVCGDPTDPDCFRKTMSIVMSHDKPIDDISFLIFDYIYGVEDYTTRSRRFHNVGFSVSNIILVAQHVVNSMDEVIRWEEEYLSRGYEGVILRDPHSTYKYGRSTMREGKLIKVKRFLDSEAIIVGMEELLHNNNEARINELGLTARASCQENKIPADTMGALIVRDIKTGVQFNIGTGFTQVERDHIWNSCPVGKIVKYKHLPIGSKDKPRLPVFLGFRNSIDL